MKGGRLYLFYSMNGEMERGEVARQLEEFRDRGVTGLFLHARAGLRIPYMSEEWFSHIGFCVETAKQLGLEIGLYDENGWPSGFAGGEVNGRGEAFWQKRIVFGRRGEDKRLLAAFRRQGRGYALCGESEGTLFAYAETNRSYVDLLNPEVTDAFLSCTHERYKARFGGEFGKTIKSIFTDEPQIARDFCYTDGIEELFLQKYGYELLPELWKMNFETKGFDRFVYDYQTLCYGLFRKNFTAKIADWCGKNGIDFTGHFAGEDSLNTVNINGGVLGQYPMIQQPAIDFLGRRFAPATLVKQVASAKNQFDKKYILSETFGCSGWNTSFEQFCSLWGYQAAMGVNLPCLHLSAYSMEGLRKRDYPAFFSYQEPWWKEFGVLADRIKAMSEAASGRQRCDVLVLSPHDCAAGLSRDSAALRDLATSYRNLVEGLHCVQIPFDLADEGILNEYGRIKKQELALSSGRYRVILVSKSLALRRETVRLLKKAVSAGIRVAFCDGYPQTESETCRKLDLTGNILVFSRAGLLQKYFEYIGYRRHIAVRAGSDGVLDDGLIVNTFGDKQLIFNLSPTGTKRLFAEIEGKPYVPFTAEPLSLTVLSAEGATRPQAFQSVRMLKPLRIVRAEPNVLTVDSAIYSLDGGSFSKIVPVIGIEDEAVRQNARRICVRYEVNFETLPPELFLCAELRSVKKLLVNGVEVSMNADGWFIDRAISRIGVSNQIRRGINTIELQYESKASSGALELGNENETERNVFVYALGIESIYFTGDFSVEAGCPVLEKIHYETLETPAFRITEAKPLSAESELTRQGLWFYRGELVFSYRIPESEGELFLGIGKGYALCKAICGGETVGYAVSEKDRIRVTEYAGRTVEIFACASNRNALGPHHHALGEPNFVGERTFRGVPGFEDCLMPTRYDQDTFSPGYHFVKNNVLKVSLFIG